MEGEAAAGVEVTPGHTRQGTQAQSLLLIPTVHLQTMQHSGKELAAVVELTPAESSWPGSNCFVPVSDP